MSDNNEGLRQIYDHIDKSSNSVTHILECVVDEIRSSDKRVKLLSLPDLQDLGWVRTYFTNFGSDFHSGALPEVGSTVLALFPRGQRDNCICLAGGMQEATDAGTTITGDNDMVIADKNGNKIIMEAGKIKISGTVVEVQGGVLQVARVTDLVSTPFGPCPIQTGSNTFLA